MKDTLMLIGLATMLGLTIVTFITFAAAYASPLKTVRVHVNSYGEADVEFILLSALLPLNVISTLLVVRRLTEKNVESYILKRVMFTRNRKLPVTKPL